MPELIIDPQDGTPPLPLRWQDGFGVQPGPLGLGVPPRDVVERARPDGRGVELVGTIVGARDVTIPLDVYGATRDEFVARRRLLQRICGRSRHDRPLRITYRDDDGAVEWIEGVYVGGLEGDEERGDDRSELFAVVLRCGFPYWRLPSREVAWSLPTTEPQNWYPFGTWPSAALVGGRRSVLILGDEEVRPPITIRGPGSRVVFANHTAGWRVELVHPIPASGPGSLITLDPTFGAQSARDGYGTNLFPKIVNGSAGGWEMGPLLPGVNDLEVAIEGQGDQSEVVFSYDPLALAV